MSGTYLNSYFTPSPPILNLASKLLQYWVNGLTSLRKVESIREELPSLPIVKSTNLSASVPKLSALPHTTTDEVSNAKPFTVNCMPFSSASLLTTLPSFTFTVSQLVSWLSVSLHGHCSCQGCPWASSMLPNPVTASIHIFFEFLAISNVLSFQMSLSVSLDTTCTVFPPASVRLLLSFSCCLLFSSVLRYWMAAGAPSLHYPYTLSWWCHLVPPTFEISSLCTRPPNLFLQL